MRRHTDSIARSPLRQAAPWLAAALGLALTLLSFWPGYLSWDSAYQWWQARHGQFDATHPPLMAQLWSLADAAWPGPAPMLVAQATLLWGSLAAFAAALPWRRGAQVALVLALGLWPPLFGLLGHVWKDVWTLAAFTAALACLARELSNPGWPLRLLALAWLALACAFRHNAITGALPLLAWLAWRSLPAGGWRRGRALALAAGLALACWGLASLPSLDPRVRPVDRPWSVVLLWDAVGVSLREGELLVPPELRLGTPTLDSLRPHFNEASNTTVFESGALRESLSAPYTPAQARALDRLAWTLWGEHTGAMLAHRARLSALLFGWDREALPDALVFSPGHAGYRDNPPLPAGRGPLQSRVQPWLQGLVDTPLFAGWLYLALALAVMLAAAWRARRRPDPWPGLALATAASSLAYALPLAVVSGSAEFRYLAWPLLAALASLALLAARERRKRLFGPPR